MKVFHADHGVSTALLSWAVSQIKEEGFFLRTCEIPEEFPDLMNALYGPVCGDAPVPESEVFYVKRSEDRPPSRMVRAPKRPTRLLTIIGVRHLPAEPKQWWDDTPPSDDEVTLFTAYGGPSATREPGDVLLSLGSDEERADAAKFWSQHALASE